MIYNIDTDNGKFFVGNSSRSRGIELDAATGKVTLMALQVPSRERNVAIFTWEGYPTRAVSFVFAFERRARACQTLLDWLDNGVTP